MVDCYCIPGVFSHHLQKGIEATKSLHNPFLIPWESMLGSVPASERSEKLSLLRNGVFSRLDLSLGIGLESHTMEACGFSPGPNCMFRKPAA